MDERAGARRAWRIVGAVAIAMVLAGCANSARVVTAITSSRDQIKFLYVEGSDQGVIQCKVSAEGSLDGCRRMGVKIEQ